MSTRSIIARQHSNGFTGTYHHWDGYPSGLGYTLWHMYRDNIYDNPKFELNDMMELLIDDHPSGLSSINGVDWSQPIGYVADYNKGRELNSPQCFCHGDRSETVDQPYTDQTDCGAEFAYTFEKDLDIETDVMHIYEKQYDDGRHTTEFFGMTTDNTKWRLIKTIDLFDENEPNWVEIQNGI